MRKSAMSLISGLFVFVMAGAQAALVTGRFSGTIYDGWGNYAGYDFTQFNGQTIKGTFSYDPSVLTTGYGFDPRVQNVVAAYTPSVPVTITESVLYQGSQFSFIFVGNGSSGVYAGRDYPLPNWSDWLNVQASPTGARWSYINLRNNAGNHYLSNIQDLASVGFEDTSTESYGNSTFGDTTYNAPYEGGFSYHITSASANGYASSGLPTINVPEPTSIVLLGVGVASLCATRRRKAIGITLML